MLPQKMRIIGVIREGHSAVLYIQIVSYLAMDNLAYYELIIVFEICSLVIFHCV